MPDSETIRDEYQLLAQTRHNSLMALGDPFQSLIILFLILLIPVVVIYWIVRLAVRHELRKREWIPAKS
ncbi:MAG TPA: hypothetical protein VNW25_00500 [Candidatus Sulfotelmatobacter sp.]|nr:hypothetical protein [Candidatus Sulfotelmatobacter sp.]